MEFTLACPSGYEPKSEFVSKGRELAKVGKGRVQIVRVPEVAVKDADAVYTDVWTSMGQEAEVQRRQSIFAPYQVNQALLKIAKPQALVMHCLPAHRGEEITESALEGPNSVVFDQAENRLHVQKAVLLTLLKKRK
jgi:ornithine carbamoyltransferase